MDEKHAIFTIGVLGIHVIVGKEGKIGFPEFPEISFGLLLFWFFWVHRWKEVQLAEMRLLTRASETKS